MDELRYLTGDMAPGDTALATFDLGTYVPDTGGGATDIVEFVSIGFIVPEGGGAGLYSVQTQSGNVLFEFGQTSDAGRFSPCSFKLYGLRSYNGFRVVITGKGIPSNLVYRVLN